MSPLLLFLKIFRFLLSTFKFKFFFCIFLSLISAVAQLSGFGLIFVLINYLKNQALDFGDDKFSILLEKLNFILDKNDQIIFLIVPFVFLLGVIFRVIGQIYVSSFSEDVKNFTLMTYEEVSEEILKGDSFNYCSNVILTKFLLDKGHITQDHPEYSDLVVALDHKYNF